MFIHTKNWEGGRKEWMGKIYCTYNNPACNSMIDVSRRLETTGSKRRTHNTADSINFTFTLVSLVSQVPQMENRPGGFCICRGFVSHLWNYELKKFRILQLTVTNPAQQLPNRETLYLLYWTLNSLSFCSSGRHNFYNLRLFAMEMTLRR